MGGVYPSTLLQAIVWMAAISIAIHALQRPTLSHKYLTRFRLLTVALIIGQLFAFFGIAYNTVWGVIATLASLLLYVVIFRVVDLIRRSAQLSLGAAATIGLLIAMLFQFGALLFVRLVVTPNPTAGFGEDITLEALQEGVLSLGAPVVMAWLLYVVWRVTELPKQQNGAAAARTLNEPKERGLRFRRAASQAWVGAPRESLVFVLVAVGLSAPLIPGLGSPDRLRFLGIATPEFAKPLWFALLAYGLSTHAYAFTLRIGGRTLLMSPAWRRVGILVTLALVTSVLRRDLGTLIPLILGGVAMMLTFVRLNDRAWLSLSEKRARDVHPLQRYGRLWLGPLAAVLLALTAAILMSPTRFATWLNPWAMRWFPACDPISDQISGIDLVGVPNGEVCLEPRTHLSEVARAQVAQGLSAIDGGGLWGRGLSDSDSGRVPVYESDFVLVAVWSKLGGLIVLFLVIATMLVWFSLRRLPLSEWEINDRPSQLGHLIVAGIGAAFTGQALYVLAATVSLVPHTGIPYPFVSRGGQSNAAWILAFAVALYLARRGPTNPIDMPRGKRQYRQSPAMKHAAAMRSPGVAGSRSAIVVISAGVLPLLVGIIAPYHSLVPFDPDAGMGRAEVQNLIANRDPVDLMLENGVVLTRPVGTGGWIVPPGYDLATLSGLLSTYGTGPGIDSATSRDRTALDRLKPSMPRRSEVILTAELELQTFLQELLRRRYDGNAYVSGAVVLDANNGEILAAASQPSASMISAPPPRDEIATTNSALSSTYVLLREADPIVLPDCLYGNCPPCLSDIDNCFRVQIKPSTGFDQDLGDYTRGDSTVPPPAVDVNRAMGQRFGLGSTFKLVIAMAHLRSGGSMNDFVAVPYPYYIDGRRVENASRSQCSGATEDRIRIDRALAVSCNTAFVELARQLGWENVSATAELLGFVTKEPRNTVPVDQTIPADAFGAAIVDAALGGGSVGGSPLGMASVAAVAANGGVWYAPTAIASHKDQVSRRVITAEQANELRAALKLVVADGTLRTISDELDPSVDLYAKTGNHQKWALRDVPPDQYSTHVIWTTGFVETKTGPVSFAIATETRGEVGDYIPANTITWELANYLDRSRGTHD